MKGEAGVRRIKQQASDRDLLLQKKRKAAPYGNSLSICSSFTFSISHFNLKIENVK